MSSVAHLPPRFNAAPGQSDIPMVRWQDRSLPYPRCQSGNVGPWGTSHSPPGLKRDRGQENDGRRPFNDLTGTLLDGSQRSVLDWILATVLWCWSCASRRLARALGVPVRTG